MLSHPEKNLAELIKYLEVERIVGDINIQVNGLSNDSRTVRPGNIFVAIYGYKTDGHSFIAKAIEKGAKAIVCQQPYPTPSPVPIIQVKNSRYAQAVLAEEFFDHPSEKLKLIGITGTNGKSTSTFMINNILEKAGFLTGLLGTVYNKVDNQIQPTLHTTPDSIEIQNFLARMVKKQIDYAIVEVSSHGIALDRIVGNKFVVGGITNITLDHLDLHGGMDDYVRTKGKFFSQLPKESIAIFNGDDSLSLQLNPYTSAQGVTYGIDSNLVNVKACDIQKSSTYTEFRLTVKKPFFSILGERILPFSFPIKLACLGNHNIYNALLAATCCLALGVTEEKIQKGLAEYTGIFRRLEVIYNEDFKVINDTAHNPGSFQAVFQVIEEEQYNNLYIVNSIRGSRGVEINKENTRIILNWALKLRPQKIFLTSAYDTSGPLDIVQEEELKVVLEMFQESGVRMEYSDSLEESIAKVCSLIAEKDLLVFLGAHSMDKATEIFRRIILSG